MGKCIFCGNGGLTREHIWADWLKAYIPRTMINHNRYHAIIHRTKTEATLKHQSGDPHSRRVRCVCSKCNNEWMSAIQEASKPFLVPMLSGLHVSLDINKQHTLAAWCSMFAIIADRDDKKLSTVTKADRDWFFKTRLAPPSWRIWAGHFKRGAWKPVYVHYVLPIAEHHIPDPADGDPPLPYNTQAMTFAVGQTLIHVMSTAPEHVSVVSSWRFPLRFHAALIEISPITSRNLDWPPLVALSDDDADFIATNFMDVINNRTRGGLAI